MRIDAELAYLAGFFDGEGCISVRRQPSRWGAFPYYFGVLVTAYNTRRAPLQRFQQTFGGSIYSAVKVAGRKRVYTWYVAGHRAVEVARQLLPYLMIKQDRALLVQGFPDRQSNGTSVAAYQHQALVWRLCKELNCLG